MGPLQTEIEMEKPLRRNWG